MSETKKIRTGDLIELTEGASLIVKGNRDKVASCRSIILAMGQAEKQAMDNMFNDLRAIYPELDDFEFSVTNRDFGNKDSQLVIIVGHKK